MAGALRQAMEYLGFAEPVERYDEYDDYAEEPAAQRSAQPQARAVEQEEEDAQAEVTSLSRRTSVAQVVQEPEVGEMNRITTIHPRTYNEAKDIGEAFRAGVPVIMNLTDMDDADAKRLVDFAAGLAFGLHGSIDRVTSKVFLLGPSHIELDSSAEVARPNAQGLFNQS